MFVRIDLYITMTVHCPPNIFSYFNKPLTPIKITNIQPGREGEYVKMVINVSSFKPIALAISRAEMPAMPLMFKHVPCPHCQHCKFPVANYYAG